MLKILILFSDTGGGHRAAAEAIRDALELKYRDCVQVVLEDGIINAAIPPFNLIPKLYLPVTTYSPWGWGLLFNLTNTRVGQAVVNFIVWLLDSRGLRRILERVDADLVLSVHPLLTRVPWLISKHLRPSVPFVTVVSDLFDAHITWFSALSDLVVVPTEFAQERGVHWGFPGERIRVVGLPVSLKFSADSGPHVNGDPAALRALRTTLGLRPDLFTVLIVGGGEGMGRIGDIAHALAQSGLPLQLIIIAGRNEVLRNTLEAEQWPVPVRVTGFVTNMPDWMRASDLVVTKAGPGTIMETLAAGRPLLISGFLPGQETGNVTFAEQTGVGVYCDSPEKIAGKVRELLTLGNDALERMRARARAEARPDAAEAIAAILVQMSKNCESDLQPALPPE